MGASRLIALLGLLLSGHPSMGQGRLTGDAGGFEKDVVLFNRDRGQVWSTITGPSGCFESKPVPASEYMALSAGRASPVIIQDGRRSEIIWGDQPGYDADTETWSPARRKFGQTFTAFGPWIGGFTFWNPGKAVPVVAELREGGPNGRLIGRIEYPEPVAWVKGTTLQPHQWPTIPGKTYCLSVESTSGEPFHVGTPALGDIHPDGQAWYDDQPMLDADIGFTIDADNDGMTTTVRVRDGFGFRQEGPAAGFCKWAGQEFRATTRNIVTAYVNAGWASDLGMVGEFVYSIHRHTADGAQVGPSRIVTMIKDWGQTAAWFPDQVPVEPGERYVLRFARTDGQPFYAYLAPNAYQDGDAVREGLDTPAMDLTCEIRGEDVTGGIFFPYNVGLSRLERDSATVSWETAVPTTSAVEYRHEDHPHWRYRAGNEEFSLDHSVTVRGLRPGTDYLFRVVGRAEGENMPVIRSRERLFSTLTDPTAAAGEGVAEPLPAGATEIALNNPGFEENLNGWHWSPPPCEGYRESLPSGVGRAESRGDLGSFEPHAGKRACGWRHRINPASGEVPRKLDPALTQVFWQTVKLREGHRYVLSAWVLTDEQEGGWNRNDRVRLCVDPAGDRDWAVPLNVNEEYVTQWYTTRGRWRRFRLAFTARSASVNVGFEFCQWWMLRENNLYVDDVRLIRLPD